MKAAQALIKDALFLIEALGANRILIKVNACNQKVMQKGIRWR